MKKRLFLFITFSALLIFTLASATVYVDGIRDDSTAKIDRQAVDGLSGTDDSLAFKIEEIERHVHGTETWYGDGGSNDLSATSFTEIVGTADEATTYGTALQISDGDDIESGDATKKMDVHRLLITTVSATDKIYKIQFLYGTGSVGTATIATEIAVWVSAIVGNTAVAGPIEAMMPRIATNNKIWIKVACETDEATIAFLIGIHTYSG